MSMLRGRLDIREEERRNTFAAFAGLLAIATGHTLLETARDTLFLAEIPVSRLPLMVMVVAAVAIALSQLRSPAAASKLGIAAMLGVGAAVTAAFWALLLRQSRAHGVLYALYVWTGIFGAWAMVEVWTLLGRVHTVTQAKRLYGFIGAGAVLGGVLGALLARAAMSWLSPRSAVLLAAGVFGLAAVPCSIVRVPADEAKQAPRRARPSGRSARRRPVTATAALLWENVFARRVLGIVFLSTVTVTLVDFLFKSQIAHEITDTVRLGAYLSTFYAASNGLAVAAQLVVAPWLFRRAGVQRALFVFPSSLLLGAGALLATGGPLAAAVALKGLDGVLRYSIHKTSIELLLVPVPRGTRERVKPLIDIAGTRGGQAVASVAILLLVAAAAASSAVLGAIVAGCAALWLVLAVTLRKSYLAVFRETLKAGGLGAAAEVPELDLGALETLFTGLNSQHDIEVIPALELLAEQRREHLIPALILYHPSRDVVLRALEIFTAKMRTDFLTIAERLNRHPDPEVAAAALRARVAVLPERRSLLERLDDGCPQVSVTALVALAALGWLEPDDARRRLDAAVRTASVPTAVELARAIRHMGSRSGPRLDPPGGVASEPGERAAIEERLDDVLVELDALAASFPDTAPDVEAAALAARGDVRLPAEVRVRLEVARAMEVRQSARFSPLLIAMLSRHELRPAARAALVATPGALAAVEAALALPGTPRDVRVHLPRTLCLFEPRDAAVILTRRLEGEQDGAVRFKMIRGLTKLRRHKPDLLLDDAALIRLVDGALDQVEALRRWRRAFSAFKAAAPIGPVDVRAAARDLLADLLRDKDVHAIERAFMLLELSHRDSFGDIWRGLRGDDAKSRASALELLENLVKPPLRERVLGLVREERAEAPTVSWDDALREIHASQSPTLQLLADVCAPALGLGAGGDAQRDAARARLGPTESSEHIAGDSETGGARARA